MVLATLRELLPGLLVPTMMVNNAESMGYISAANQGGGLALADGGEIDEVVM